MMNELLAFSQVTHFEIFFLREQDEFYREGINELKSNGVNIYEKAFVFNNLTKKLMIIFKFLIKYILKFRFDYNGVIGLKSLIWFLKLDLSKLSPESKIHAQFATQAAIVSLLIKKYYDDKPEYSFTFHAHDIYFKNKWFDLLVGNCYKAFSISEYNIDYVKKKYLDSDKIILSRLGVFRNQIQKVDLSNKKNPKIFTLGLISWFVEKKGIHYLLEAMLKLKRDGFDDIKLTLAGDGPLKNKYLKFIDKNSLSGNINYIGKIKGKQKQDFFDSLDAFILPAISLSNDQDGIPVVLMEAVSYSLPIISTNISGIPEICINKYNGYLIEQKNVEEIVRSIIKLSNNHDNIDFQKNSYELSKQYDIQLNSTKKLNYLKWLQS